MSHSRDSIHQLTKITHTKLAGGLPVALSASGNLKISIEESSAGGDASLAEQQTQTAHLAVIEGDTTSLDGKITACDTGAVVVSSSALPTGAATEASLTAQQYQEADAIGASSKGVLIMGRNGSNNAKPIHITNNGDIEVEIADFVKGQAASSASFPVVLASDQSELSARPETVNNLGSQANIINNASLANGANSSSVDVSNFNTAMVWVEDASTASSDGYDLEVSEDNTNFYAMTSLYPSVRGGKREGVLYDLRLNGVKYVRLFNNSSTDTYTNIYATIVGSPN